MTKKIKRKSARAKGYRGQTEFKQTILNYLPILPNEIRTALASEHGIDVQMVSDYAKELLPYAFQVKYQEKLSIWKSWEQTKKDAEKANITPVLIIRRNHSDVLWVMKVQDRLEEIKQQLDK